MTGDMFITFGILAVFFAIIVAILYATFRQDKTFTGYAVGGRSFKAIYIAMSYTNSWWPGTTFIAYFGLTAAFGVIGWYALLYTLLGVPAMYLMARQRGSGGRSSTSAPSPTCWACASTPSTSRSSPA